MKTTTAYELQKIIESQVEKRTKGVYTPFGMKKMLLFIDDFNMPEKDGSDSQPPLELIRHWINYGFWYDQKTQAECYIKNLIPLSAMSLPNGETTTISPRLLSRYNILNLIEPNEAQIEKIFEPIISHKLSSFSEDVKTIGETVIKATIEMYSAISVKLLPTPSKMHYMFNLRDISLVKFIIK
ncbi:dynein heavy chain 2, axonemal-like [Octopus sinensis]|uniref:Dynein heavy chain 2, axonemal-like n=1 Tax=Octopus sinensis TaxID=2607531 RepID=A0A6P7U2C9_9MOLL|nr:dynein heavy chain 2, axonemal-like [Octopus sinensis]